MAVTQPGETTEEAFGFKKPLGYYTYYGQSGVGPDAARCPLGKGEQDLISSAAFFLGEMSQENDHNGNGASVPSILKGAVDNARTQTAAYCADIAKGMNTLLLSELRDGVDKGPLQKVIAYGLAPFALDHYTGVSAAATVGNPEKAYPRASRTTTMANVKSLTMLALNVSAGDQPDETHQTVQNVFPETIATKVIGGHVPLEVGESSVGKDDELQKRKNNWSKRYTNAVNEALFVAALWGDPDETLDSNFTGPYEIPGYALSLLLQKKDEYGRPEYYTGRQPKGILASTRKKKSGKIIDRAESLRLGLMHPGSDAAERSTIAEGDLPSLNSLPTTVLSAMEFLALVTAKEHNVHIQHEKHEDSLQGRIRAKVDEWEKPLYEKLIAEL